MQIEAAELGRRYGRTWIFRRLSYCFRPGSATAILGPNGAGKSTLLLTLAGQLLPTEGTVAYSLNGRPLAAEDVPPQLALCAPYLELLEDFTLLELLRFHLPFKPLRPGLSEAEFLQLVYLEKARHQPVREFSSGMKQRLKLGLALYAAAPLLLLDEPTTNLDRQGVAWYAEHLARVRQLAPERLVVVSSNVPAEYAFCEAELRVTDFQ